MDLFLVLTWNSNLNPFSTELFHVRRIFFLPSMEFNTFFVFAIDCSTRPMEDQTCHKYK